MRTRVWLVVLVWMVAGCSTPEPTRAEVESSLERLRPEVTDVVIEEAIEDCLREHAVTSLRRVPDGGGFVGSGVTERDQRVYDECQEGVLAEYDWPPPQPESVSDYRAMYELYLEQAACLEDLGYEIDVPSFDTYYDDRGWWAPYKDLPPKPPPSEWRKLNETCPQDPWTYYDQVADS